MVRLNVGRSGPVSKKHFSLTTLQGKLARLWLANQNIYRAGWRRHSAANPWNQSYAWMCRQMMRRGMDIGRHAPIWAWPDSRECGGPTTYGAAYALLGEPEIEAGIWVMRLRVPSEYCLRSCYRIWNSVLDDFLLGGSVEDVPTYLFDRPLYRHVNPLEADDIQFCLPFIHRNWVRSTRLLAKGPDDVGWEKTI